MLKKKTKKKNNLVLNIDSLVYSLTFTVQLLILSKRKVQNNNFNKPFYFIVQDTTATPVNMKVTSWERQKTITKAEDETQMIGW